MKCIITSIHYLSLLIIFSLLLQNCKPGKKDSGEYEKWTSTDPLSVNYKTRKQKFDDQNLVYNSSFEIGRVKKLDSLTSSIKVDGWSLIGQSVVWINSDGDSALNDSGLVHSGLHSIHIQRRHADETESTGQGVLSDYIRVIPGNYSLSLYLNLKDIFNPKSRLGTKIFDAVNIRVLYYDKNKIQISQKKYSEYYKSNIDNSFKGLSFANFQEIDSTGWLHILGRSHIFPYQDGDLQDDAKFVRIFVGLKGTGDLWMDDIDFRYTKWNFTTLERVSSYFDTILSKSDLIVPQPVDVDILESVIYYRPYYKESFPVILIPYSPDRITMDAAKEFERRIKEYLISIAGIDSLYIPSLIKEGSLPDDNNASIVFSIGNNILFNKHRSELPLQEISGKKQGFFIHSPDDIKNVVFLYGNSSNANYYAVQAALQLFDNKKLLFHNANVIDYPFRDERSLLITGLNDYSLKFFNTTIQTRFSNIYLPARSEMTKQLMSGNNNQSIFLKWLYYDMDSESENYTKDLSILQNLISSYQKNVAGLAFMFHFPFKEEINIEAALNYSSKNCTNKTENSNLNMLNDFVRSISLPVEFMPCYSSNLNISSNHFCGSQNNYSGQKISCIWSGYDLQSWKIDEADLLYFKKQCKFPIAFLDYTMYPRDRNMGYFGYDPLYPYKLLTASIFEPYENEIVPEVYDNIDKIIVAYNVSNVFDRIRLQTASDFLWNPKSYNADLSLYKALVSEFGIETAQEILKFNDLYFKIKSELIIAKDPALNTKQHLRKTANLLNQIKIIRDKLAEEDQTNSNTELNNILGSLIRELELIIKSIEETSTEE